MRPYNARVSIIIGNNIGTKDAGLRLYWYLARYFQVENNSDLVKQHWQAQSAKAKNTADHDTTFFGRVRASVVFEEVKMLPLKATFATWAKLPQTKCAEVQP